MTESPSAYAKIMKDYRAQLQKKWEQIPIDSLGVERLGNEILVPLFGKKQPVSPQDIGRDNPDNSPYKHMVSVLLVKYLLGTGQPMDAQDSNWVAYREFKDAAPFVEGYANTVERHISGYFGGKLQDLEGACSNLAGQTPSEPYSYDLARWFPALPRVPVLMLFNDADEDFPAQCSVLFQQDADNYLDMECLVIAGICLALFLEQPKSLGGLE
jgi:hypothetical protein